MEERKRNFDILMVCTEYPPMQGGIGRYTFNLVKSLRAKGIEIKVLSNSDGAGDYDGLSPTNKNNSEILYNLVQKLNPDIVHIQYDHGLFGFDLHPLFPNRTKTGFDKFYSICKVPIVTTFHTSYKFNQWMQSILINGKDPLHLKYLYEYWKYLINYSSFQRINTHAMSKSSAGIVFSNYMANLVPGTKVIYHGAEPFQSVEIEQKEARKMLSLPENERIVLVQGFLTASKGWNIIKKMDIPEGWKLVINYSKNHYNKQMIDLKLNNKKNIIDLEKDYLSEEDLSLLFFASDIVFLPYKAIAGSGTMFDGLGHGKPFLATNAGFFKEFSKLNLGIVTERNTSSFEKGLKTVNKNYELLKSNVDEFRKNLKWELVAKQHLEIYENILNANKDKDIKLIATKKVPEKS
ncbi:MAG: glycosyltransferase family 4 protein [Thermoproteota archaeon]|nr:glycosyltransferase family 4 protein [Thermoproteota archaeon]